MLSLYFTFFLPLYGTYLYTVWYQADLKQFYIHLKLSKAKVIRFLLSSSSFA